MKTKTYTIVFLSLFLSVSVKGQLNATHNHFRPGDEIVKQQVEYVDPGEAGRNRTWDFSKLNTINDAYTLTYSVPPLLGDSVYIMGDYAFPKDEVKALELVTGTEHMTMYFYRLSNDTLYLLGHENPAVRLMYTTPIVQAVYPLNYGQHFSSEYISQGLYSGIVGLSTEGTETVEADAFGKMILPTGDTLNPVLRVKSTRLIIDTRKEEPADSMNIGQVQTIVPPKQVETCRWYTKGYRYPVFETIRNIDLSDNSEVFSTAFYYPPQEHLYLQTDPDNQALLDELWKGTETEQTNTENQQVKKVALEDIMTCKIYPNPVISQINLEYELKEDAKVSFELYSMDGIPVKRISLKTKPKGIHYETLDCSSLYPKNYLLRITANNLSANEIIIKK